MISKTTNSRLYTAQWQHLYSPPRRCHMISSYARYATTIFGIFPMPRYYIDIFLIYIKISFSRYGRFSKFLDGMVALAHLYTRFASFNDVFGPSLYALLRVIGITSWLFYLFWPRYWDIGTRVYMPHTPFMPVAMPFLMCALYIISRESPLFKSVGWGARDIPSFLLAWAKPGSFIDIKEVSTGQGRKARFIETFIAHCICSLMPLFSFEDILDMPFHYIAFTILYAAWCLLYFLFLSFFAYGHFSFIYHTISTSPEDSSIYRDITFIWRLPSVPYWLPRFRRNAWFFISRFALRGFWDLYAASFAIEDYN